MKLEYPEGAHFCVLPDRYSRHVKNSAKCLTCGKVWILVFVGNRGRRWESAA